MSLINKMLQDLDARGAAAGQTLQGNVRPVPARHRGLAAPVWWAGAALLLLTGAALAWRYFAQVAPLPVAAAPTVAPAPAPAASPSAPMPRALALAPAASPSAPMPRALALAPAASPSAPMPRALASVPAASPSAPMPRAVARAPAATTSSAGDFAALPPVNARSGPMKRAPAPAPEWRAQSAQGVAADAGRELSPSQEAQVAYRKALSDLQDGRSRAAMNGLEQALQIDPRHDAARQTLIGLLLENKRQDEAIQQLKQGLALDPGQTALAMALARLQVEQGGPALQTLLRSLPYASERADYQAFVATLMEREQRHKEAVGYYEAALRLSPQSGVWWMGLGISLQADQRLQEARVAYQRARTSGRLAPELDSFVEKKLQQLAK